MRGKKTPIVAINPSGSLAGYFESLTDAAKRLDVNVSTIANALTKGRLSKGVKWMYEEKFRHLWMCHPEKLPYQIDPRIDRFTGKMKKGCTFRPKGAPVSAKQLAALAENRKKSSLQGKPVRNVNDGMIFGSMCQAALHYGVSHVSVWNSVKTGKPIKKIKSQFEYYHE